MGDQREAQQLAPRRALGVDDAQRRFEVGPHDVRGQALPRLYLDKLEGPLVILVVAAAQACWRTAWTSFVNSSAQLHGQRRGQVEDRGQARRGRVHGGTAGAKDGRVELRRDARRRRAPAGPHQGLVVHGRAGAALSMLATMFLISTLPGLSSSTASNCALASALSRCDRHHRASFSAFVGVARGDAFRLEPVNVPDRAERPFHELLAKTEHAPVLDDRIRSLVHLDLSLVDFAIVQREHRRRWGRCDSHGLAGRGRRYRDRRRRGRAPQIRASRARPGRRFGVGFWVTWWRDGSPLPRIRQGEPIMQSLVPGGVEVPSHDGNGRDVLLAGPARRTGCRRRSERTLRLPGDPGGS